MVKALCCGFFAMIFAMPASAACKWGNFDLKQGDKFIYELTNSEGRTKTLTETFAGIKDGLIVIKRSDDKTERYNSFGAWVKGDDEYTESHSGGTAANMAVGSKWKHRYDIRNEWKILVTRERTCEVLANEKKAVPAGTFDVVHVRCDNQRVDRSTPIHEDRWYNICTGRSVAQHNRWRSGNSESTSKKILVKVERAPR